MCARDSVFLSMVSMNTKQTIKVEVNDLQVGMYVCDLDRPWLETPYLIQGILIQSEDDIERLKRYCTLVYVDVERSVQDVSLKREKGAVNVNQQSVINNAKAHSSHATFSLDNALCRTTTYSDSRSVEHELPAATKAYQATASIFDDISNNIESNIKFDIRVAQDVVNTLCESIIRNPDAAMLMAQLKVTGKELYDNAIKTSVHLLAFGRHLGLPRKELAILGLGGLLMDIGRQRLPKSLQTKRSLWLKPDERKLMKQHVQFGQEIVTQLSDASDEVVMMVVQHHERENGNGYPNGLYANQLHPYSRMAAIVDCYEELIWGQPDLQGMKPSHALKELKDNVQNGLSLTLVEQFAQCVGIFPIGSLVELNSGEIAIVLAHNRTQRFLPSIMIICDASRKPYAAPVTLDLRTAGPNPAGVSYAIASDLPQGAYGIDAKKYYL